MPGNTQISKWRKTLQVPHSS